MLRLSTIAMFNKTSDYLIPLLSWIESTDTFFRFREWMQTFRNQIETVNFSKMSRTLKEIYNDRGFKDELKGFQNILNEIKKLKLLREQEINEIKNES